MFSIVSTLALMADSRLPNRKERLENLVHMGSRV